MLVLFYLMKNMTIVVFSAIIFLTINFSTMRDPIQFYYSLLNPVAAPSKTSDIQWPNSEAVFETQT